MLTVDEIIRLHERVAHALDGEGKAAFSAEEIKIVGECLTYKEIDADIENWFSYHAPRPGQAEKYEAIRSCAKWFAQVIRNSTPPGPDQSVAIRKIREAVMTANAAIACSRGE